MSRLQRTPRRHACRKASLAAGKQFTYDEFNADAIGARLNVLRNSPPDMFAIWTKIESTEWEERVDALLADGRRPSAKVNAPHRRAGFRSLLIAAAFGATFPSAHAAAQTSKPPAARAASEGLSEDAARNRQRALAVPTPEQMKLPGMTRASIKTLPPLMGSLWVPENVPVDERAYLARLALPPLRPDFVEDARAAIEDIRAGRAEAPSKSCAFDGQPRLAWYPYPVQFLFAPGHVMLLQHWFARSAPVSGLDHPPEFQDKEKIKTLEIKGDAAAIWQNGTLVIDTIAVREDIDTFYGIPNDPDLHVVERFRLLADGRLERRTTVDSPSYFTRPWETVTTYRRAPEISWATHFCLPAAKGKERGQ